MDNQNELKDIVIIYHADCPDGFGAAYAAWKKFGDKSSYLPRPMPAPLPEDITGKTLYIIDYSYDKATLERLIEVNASVVVIDHHQTAKDAVTSFPQNIFDINHSGAVLAWQYFHPDQPVPSVLLYVEDHDIWNNSLPEHIEFNVALNQVPRTFQDWDTLIENLKDENFLINFIAKGSLMAKFESSIITELADLKERVLFEGHEVWAINYGGRHKSILGNMLAEENSTAGGIAFGIIYAHFRGKVSVSLRSRGDVDVSAIALKYGGGGHKNASRFQVDSFNNLPFSFINKIN